MSDIRKWFMKQHDKGTDNGSMSKNSAAEKPSPASSKPENLVVDETDRLLREAYQSWLPTVIQLTSSSTDGNFPSAADLLCCTYGSLKTIRRVGTERGFKGKSYPRLAKMVLSATLTQDPSKLSQLGLHHPLLLTTGEKRNKLPEKLKSFKVLCQSKLKPLYLVSLLQGLHGEKSILFTSSVESTHRLCTLLKFFDNLQIEFKEYLRLQRQSERRSDCKSRPQWMLLYIYA